VEGAVARLKRRGLDVAPELAIADGALGFWKALGEVWARPREPALLGATRPRTCSTSCPSPSNATPRSRFKTSGWPTRKPPPKPRSIIFAEVYGAKYDKAVACLTKDRSALLAFYDFPAEHWKHLPLDQPDREQRLQPVRIELSARRAACRTKPRSPMVYKLTDAAQKNWRRLDGPNQLPKLIQGGEIHRRSRGHLASNSSRRLISSVTNFRR